jgi:hypothetical protein
MDDIVSALSQLAVRGSEPVAHNDGVAGSSPAGPPSGSTEPCSPPSQDGWTQVNDHVWYRGPSPSRSTSRIIRYVTSVDGKLFPCTSKGRYLGRFSTLEEAKAAADKH